MHKSFLSIVVAIVGIILSSSNALALTLHTTSFVDRSSLPATYTCDGKNISPQLSWSEIPPNTQSFVFILSDPDAPGGTFYHWVLYNIPASVNTLAEGMNRLPMNAKLGENSWNTAQYRGPCPPKGAIHTYLFTLYALDTMLMLPNGVNANTLLAAMQNHLLAQAELFAIYGH